MIRKNKEYLEKLVKELISLSTETEWVEFKKNNADAKEIGEYISALANSATLWNKEYGYMIFGIDNDTHKIVGTTFEYRKAKRGAEELEAWLSRMLSPRINFKFYELKLNELNITILEIPCADNQPIKFSGEEYIRIGTNKKNLKEYPEKERALWKAFDSTPYELKIAMTNITSKNVMLLLNYIKYYEMLRLAIQTNTKKVLEDFINEKFIKRNEIGNFDITNLGAILIANDLKKFEELGHKIVRVIWYKSNDRLETIREKTFDGGYALLYEEIIEYILTIIPQEEIIKDSIRENILSFPEIAIRELVANTLIHQSLEQKGTNPMIEVFSNRIEFSNAGSPLVSINRIIDTVPLSRNENLAGFMHKCGICEERGSGYDKVIFSTSSNSMIAPKIENQDNSFTKVILYSKIPFDLTKKEDRIRTCYMKACLSYVNGQAINNSDIRELFGLSLNDKYKSSRIIKDTLEKRLIKPVDELTAPRYMKYIPFWA